LPAELAGTLLAENVRDCEIFLTDSDGIIKCWARAHA
jgi:hypothetical protein